MIRLRRPDLEPDGHEHDPAVGAQIDYYRARAAEYDQWWYREGRYDRGLQERIRWFREVEIVQDALARFDPAGRVLEIACGTGLWTQRLVAYADAITALDASAEMIARNHARLKCDAVTYVEADVFDWRPDGPYDAVFFGFWLSHVPPERFRAFWALVRDALRPGGRVFFVDSLYAPEAVAVDHDPGDRGAVVRRRRLNDGREFEVVKMFYEPDELAARLTALGWRVDVATTPTYFLYGQGAPS